jgi:hypothetical protein
VRQHPIVGECGLHFLRWRQFPKMKRTISQRKRRLSWGALKSALSFSGRAARAQASDLHDCASHLELHAGDFFAELLHAYSRVHLARGPTGLANQEYCCIDLLQDFRGSASLNRDRPFWGRVEMWRGGVRPGISVVRLFRLAVP